MLHIHNGDSTADTAKQSSLPGEHLAWRESLITGPTPAGLSADDWRQVRAAHLSASYGGEEREVALGLLKQEEDLASFAKHDEVVLWFEHDLFCQLHLIYLLNWFSQHDLGGIRLSLICIDEFPGKKDFRGLGELNAEQLASLFPARQQVTNAQLALAASAWQAYCSPNPTAIEAVVRQDTSPLSFLSAALRAHLARFPSTRNGLGHIENRALEFMKDGPHSFTDLFSRFGKSDGVYGLGDAQFWLALERMSTAHRAFLLIKGLGNNGNVRLERTPKFLTPEVVRNAKLELTSLGEFAFTGQADFVNLNDDDRWLGGVHLQINLWRWNEDASKLESPA